MKLAAILFAGIGLLQQGQVFRSQANVTAIDVTVLDKNGRVVRSLGPDDFVVTARRQARKVISADFVELRPAVDRRTQTFPEPALTATSASSNRAADRGRVFILAIDVSMIGLGEGRVQMRQVSEFLDHLAPEDIVGLVSLPTFTPRVELTRDRAAIRDALNGVVGSSNRYLSCGPTYGEAAAIASGDQKSASRAMLDRLGNPPRCVGGTGNSRVAIPEYRIHTTTLLDSLGALADGLKTSPGLKTIVLVAEGMFANQDNRDDIARLAARTEAAGTRVYALHLDSPAAEAQTRGNVTSTHDLDDHYGFDAMAEVAAATGGTAFRISGSVIPRLDQIDEESSGYYVLQIETDATDSADKPIDLSVRSRRPGLDIRSRRLFTTRLAAGRGPSTSSGDAASTAQLLQSPINIGEIPIDVETIGSYAPASQTTQRHLIVANVTAPAGNVTAIGFHVATLAGRTIAYKIESPVVLAETGGAPYVVALDLEPGAYRLRLACVDRNGARGSIERLFTVKPAAERSDLSEILFGVDNASPWKPIAALAPGQKRLGVRVELADAPATAGQDTVKLLIGRAGQNKWIGQADLTIAGGDARRTASGAINVSQLDKGAYVVKVEFWRNGAITAFTVKQFDVR